MLFYLPFHCFTSFVIDIHHIVPHFQVFFVMNKMHLIALCLLSLQVKNWGSAWISVSETWPSHQTVSGSFRVLKTAQWVCGIDKQVCTWNNCTANSSFGEWAPCLTERNFPFTLHPLHLYIWIFPKFYFASATFSFGSSELKKIKYMANFFENCKTKFILGFERWVFRLKEIVRSKSMWAVTTLPKKKEGDRVRG